MKAIEVKYQLKLRGYSMARIARELDISPTAVSLVIEKTSNSQKTQKFINDILIKPVSAFKG